MRPIAISSPLSLAAFLGLGIAALLAFWLAI